MFLLEICNCPEDYGEKKTDKNYLAYHTNRNAKNPIEVSHRITNSRICTYCNLPKITKDQAEEAVRKAIKEKQREQKLLNGDEIRVLRNKMGMTVRAFGEFLGISFNYLSAVENFRWIQSKGNDQIIRIKTAEFIKKSDPKRRKLKSIFSKMMQEVGTSKLFLNKMMFYIDFKHFKKFGKSITGSDYVAMQYGPCPKDFYAILQEMIEDGNIIPIEEHCFKVKKSPDMSGFSDKELETIDKIINLCREDGGRALYDLSHKEKGFLETPLMEEIPYEYAKDLQIE